MKKEWLSLNLPVEICERLEQHAYANSKTEHDLATHILKGYFKRLDKEALHAKKHRNHAPWILLEKVLPRNYADSNSHTHAAR